jgi:hypothetical protein
VRDERKHHGNARLGDICGVSRATERAIRMLNPATTGWAGERHAGKGRGAYVITVPCAQPGQILSTTHCCSNQDGETLNSTSWTSPAEHGRVPRRSGDLSLGGAGLVIY